nr:uncharacterized protein CTRU02_08152 [Colletotrichum truncatum]KAF6790632.1 hypothetical protein CTRU02_08152 [Colletotrichum truncatum]
MLFQSTQYLTVALSMLAATAAAAPTEIEARQQPKEIGACYDSKFTCAFQGCFAGWSCAQISGGTAACCVKWYMLKD